MNKIIFIFLLLLNNAFIFSLSPNEYESVCLQAIKRIESALESKLPDGYYIVDQHMSSFGGVVNNQIFIRDCLIEKKHLGQIFAQAYIFTYPKDSNFAKQFTNQDLGDIELSYPDFSIKIGLLSENKELLDIIKNVIHSISFDGIEPIAF